MNEEYERLYRAMQTYCSGKNKKIDEDKLCCKKFFQYFVLIANNSGFRTSELKQLKWNEVIIERHKNKIGSEIKLAQRKYWQKQAKPEKVGQFCVEMYSTLRDLLKYLKIDKKKISSLV